MQNMRWHDTYDIPYPTWRMLTRVPSRSFSWHFYSNPQLTPPSKSDDLTTERVLYRISGFQLYVYHSTSLITGNHVDAKYTRGSLWWCSTYRQSWISNIGAFCHSAYFAHWDTFPDHYEESQVFEKEGSGGCIWIWKVCPLSFIRYGRVEMLIVDSSVVE